MNKNNKSYKIEIMTILNDKTKKRQVIIVTLHKEMMDADIGQILALTIQKDIKNVLLVVTGDITKSQQRTIQWLNDRTEFNFNILLSQNEMVNL